MLSGKYRLDRVLGVGGMGAVYAATHRNRRRFAIKLLHPELSNWAEVRARFLREGYVSNSVDHPGAVAVLDDDVAEDGSAFLVMELLHGKNLEELWEHADRRLPFPVVAALMDQALGVLAAAHAQDIVHRDLKPANLFLTDDGVVKVLDFGIARLREATGAKGTRTGATLGTPAFMAPEQARGQSNQVDHRTDLWAIGATLFMLLGRRTVHEGETAQQLLIRAATCAAPPLVDVAPEVPRAFADVVDKALAFEREDRWQSAVDMQLALLRAHDAGATASLRTLQLTPAALLWPRPSMSAQPASSFATVAPSPRVDSVALPVVHSTRPVGESRTSAGRRPGRIPWRWLAAGLALTAGLAVVVAATHRHRAERVEAPLSSSPGHAISPSGVASVPSPPPRATASASASPARRPASTPAQPVPAPPGSCARLLERQSLGEGLGAVERAALDGCRH